MNKSTFKTTFWLLVPDQRFKQETHDFLRQMGKADEYVTEIPCDDVRTVQKNGYAVWDEGEVRGVLERASEEGISLDVFVCREGSTHGELYKMADVSAV